MRHNGFGLGEVCEALAFAVGQIAPNPCYALVAVYQHKFSIEAMFFYLFCGLAKNILLFSCVYHIHDVYLYQKLKQQQNESNNQQTTNLRNTKRSNH